MRRGRPVEISWPSVSRHVKVLEQAGLVSSARLGGNIIYSLETSVLEDIATEVADMAGIGRPPRSKAAIARTLATQNLIGPAPYLAVGRRRTR